MLMLRYPLCIALLVSTSTFTCGIALAQGEDEIQRRDLATIQSQLAQVQVVIDRIEKNQSSLDPKSTRVYLNTAALKADVSAISEGINSYLTPERIQPRVPESIVGDYMMINKHER